MLLVGASDGVYRTEQVVADAGIVQDVADRRPVGALESVNVSPGEPTAVQVATAWNTTLLGEQLSGAWLAARALAEPPSQAAVTTSAATTAGQVR